jgi:hypothetical protein
MFVNIDLVLSVIINNNQASVASGHGDVTHGSRGACDQFVLLSSFNNIV